MVGQSKSTQRADDDLSAYSRLALRTWGSASCAAPAGASLLWYFSIPTTFVVGYDLASLRDFPERSNVRFVYAELVDTSGTLGYASFS